MNAQVSDFWRGRLPDPRAGVDRAGSSTLRRRSSPCSTCFSHRPSSRRRRSKPDRAVDLLRVEVDLGVDWAVAKSPGAQARRRPHDRDVLLRHRLLPQPGGFEGLFPRHVLTAPRNLAQTCRRCIGQSDLDATQLRSSAHVMAITLSSPASISSTPRPVIVKRVDPILDVARMASLRSARIVSLQRRGGRSPRSTQSALRLTSIPARYPLLEARTTSTFSCDIARAVSRDGPSRWLVVPLRRRHPSGFLQS